MVQDRWTDGWSDRQNVNNSYGWVMLQKLPVNNFEWIEDTFQFNEDFIKSYNEETDEGYFLEVDVQYPKNLHKLHNDLPLLPKRIKIEKSLLQIYMIKVNMLFTQALNQRLVLKKVHRVIKFNQKIWLKPYIDMNTKLRKKAKTNFEKNFFKLMNNAVFG